MQRVIRPQYLAAHRQHGGELTARGYQLILRTTGLDSDQGPTAAKYILEKVKPQRIAIVHDKQQYGEGLARAVQV